jgi:protein-disulfide isomerase
MGTPSLFQRSLDAIAGTAMIVASGAIFWKLFFASPPPTQSPPEPLPAEPISVEGSAIEGRSDARLGIVQFSEFQCPFCGRFARETLPQLRERYIATGRAFLSFQHLPLESKHPYAFEAALITTCASDHGKFWSLHDRLFARSDQALDERALAVAVEAIGFPETFLAECRMTDAGTRVRRDLARAQNLSVRGTPTFFVGLRTPSGQLKVLHRLTGALPFSSFETVLDKLEADLATLSR